MEVDLLAVPFVKAGKNPTFSALNKKTRGALEALANAEKFKGEEDRTLDWQGKVDGRFLRIMAVGMGNGQAGPDKWRLTAAKAVRHATKHRLRSVAFFLDGSQSEQEADEVRWVAEAMILSAYRFRKYKSRGPRNAPPKAPKEGFVGVHPKITDRVLCGRAIRDAKADAVGVLLARDLVNEPANVLSPQELAERAGKIAAQKGLQCSILGPKELGLLGAGLLLAVAAGSKREPRLVHLIYTPRKKARGKVVFVGKGVTFDSGGLCVKPGKSMYTMKTDMAGAGAVLGIMSALKTRSLDVEVHGVMPLTDNAIGGDAVRPGDVVKSLLGITVEVLNTDAEGRLILADALTYAGRLKPDLIVDYATLTGACTVALGVCTAGLFSPNDDIARKYLAAAERAGEPMWRLPLLKELNSDLQSDVADIKNIGGQHGGAITAALFLKRFVDKTPWIHLDIAGPARAEKSTDLCPKGGSGFGVLTGLEYLSRL
jgi:leucyl aminopeptidase